MVDKPHAVRRAAELVSEPCHSHRINAQHQGHAVALSNGDCRIKALCQMDVMASAPIQARAQDRIRETRGSAVIEHVWRRHRGQAQLDLDRVALVGTDAQAVFAQRCLSLVATTSCRQSRENARPAAAALARRSSTEAHPAASSVRPMRSGSCRSTRLMNLLIDVSSNFDVMKVLSVVGCC